MQRQSFRCKLPLGVSDRRVMKFHMNTVLDHMYLNPLIIYFEEATAERKALVLVLVILHG